MKRLIWLAVFTVAVVAAGMTLVARPRGPEWTTSSPEAAAEFEAGSTAQAKVYFVDAREHFKRAYELDPEFVMAKWRYANALRETDPEQSTPLQEELMTVDLGGLTAREKFLIERWRATRQERTDDADRILDDYIAKHPNDPYGLSAKAGQAWFREDLERAERLYQHLLSIDPNWVNAYNALGYIAMTQGRFIESEEYFKSYRFIAPDQANPHDSLGELFITLGRHAEAESSLERAIEIKPDFWASYENLATMKAYAGDPDGARSTIERGRVAGMPEDISARLACLTRYAELADREAWQQILDERGSGCLKNHKNGYPTIITHLAACRLGNWEMVQTIEDEAAGVLLETEQQGDDDRWRILQAMIHHLQGVRLATRGSLETAQERLRAADQRLSYVPSQDSLFKIYNRMILAETMLAAGQDAEAHQLLAKVRNVNPPMVADFERSRFRILGLSRG